MRNSFTPDVCGIPGDIDVALRKDKISSMKLGQIYLIRTTMKNYLSTHSLEDVNRKIKAYELEGELTEVSDENDLDALAKNILLFKKFLDKETQINKLSTVAGLKLKDSVELYRTFKTIPIEYRYEMVNQLLMGFIHTLDNIQDTYGYADHAEILNTVDFDELVETVHEGIVKALKKKYNNDLTTARQDPAFVIAEDALKGEKWASLLFMVKGALFESENVKLGSVLQFAQDYDDDMQATNADGEQIRTSEEQGQEHWMQKADTLLAFAGLTREVRAALFKIAKEEEKGIFGMPKKADVYEIHQNLIDLVHNAGCNSSADFIETLKNNKNKWAKDLIMFLDNDKTGILKTKFFVCYKRNRLNYVSHEHGKNGKLYRVTSTERAAKKAATLISNIYDIRYPENCIFTSDGSINQANFKLYQKVIDTLMGLFTKNDDGKYEVHLRRWVNGMSGISDAAIRTDIISQINKYLNLNIGEADFIDLANNEVRFHSFLYNLLKMHATVFKKGAPLGFNVKTLLENKSYSFYFKNFINTALQYTSEVNASKVVERTTRYMGSTYTAATVPSHLGDLLDNIRKAGEKGVTALKAFIEDEYLKCPVYATPKKDGGYIIHNKWVKSLYETTDKDLKNPSSFYNQFINGLQRSLGNELKKWEDFTEGEMLQFYIEEFGKVFNDSNGTLCSIPLFVTGDSNSSRSFTLTAEKVITEGEMEDSIVDLLTQEIVRMNAMDEFLSWIEINEYSGFEKASLKQCTSAFTLFPYANKYIDKDTIDELKKLLKNDENGITQVKAKLKEKALDGTPIINIKGALQDALKEFKNSLINEGLLISTGLNISWNTDKVKVPYILKEEANKLGLSEDGLYFNALFSNMTVHLANQLSFLTVDPSFYKSTEDMQKRFKEMIASGNKFDTAAVIPFGEDAGKFVVDQNNTNQVGIYFDDVTMNMLKEDAEFLESLKNDKRIGEDKRNKYNFVRLTDGQAYRSFNSYRAIMIMSGAWTENMEKVWEIINKHRKAVSKNREEIQIAKEKQLRGEKVTIPEEISEELSDDEWAEIIRLDVVFQPKKLFYYQYEKIEKPDGTFHVVAVQHKYAEIPLIPELLPEDAAQLKALGRVMDKRGLDFAMSTECVKVGNFGSAANFLNCKTVDDYEKSLDKAHVHVLSLEGLREQNNVPEHNDTARARGTQVTKHMYMGLGEDNFEEVSAENIPFFKALSDRGIKKFKLGKNHSIDLDHITGKDLMNLVTALGSAGFLKSMRALSNQLKTEAQFAKVMFDLKLADSRSTTDAIEAFALKFDGSMTLPLNELTAEADNMAALLSKFRKEVIKQRFQGGSYVQVAPFGLQETLKIHYRKKNGKAVGIMDVDCAIPFDLSYIGLNNEKVKLNYLDYVDPRTGRPLKKDGTKFKSDDEILDDWSNTKLGYEFPKIQELVAYRIPTEKAYSIISLRVKRFFPKTSGGIIMVPAHFTKIAGFDFDIDKLYFMRREFVLSDEISDEYQKESPKTQQMWTDIYTKTPVGRTIFPYLKKAKEGYDRTRNALRETIRSEVKEKWISENIKDPKKVIYTVEQDDKNETYKESLKIDPKYYKEVEELIEKELKDQKLDAKSDKKRYYEFWQEAIQIMANEEVPLPEGKTYMTYFKTASEIFVEEVRKTEKPNWASNYNPNKTVLGNTQAAVNNMMLDFIKYRLACDDTFAERYTPGGYWDIEDSRKKMLVLDYANKETLQQIKSSSNPENKLTELSEDVTKDTYIKYSPTSLVTVAHYQSANAVSDKLISMAAVYSINQRLTAMMKYSLKVPIKFGSILGLTDKGAGMDISKRMFDKGGDEYLDTESLVTQCLAAAVDAVKDSSLEYFGLNVRTFSLACLAARVGATSDDIGFLFKQPVVKRAIKIASEGRTMGLSQALNEAFEQLCDPNKEFIKNNKAVKEEWDKAIKQPEDSSENTSLRGNSRDEYLTSDKLVSYIVDERLRELEKEENPNAQIVRDKEWVKGQYAVVHVLQQLQKEASAFADQCSGSHATSIGTIGSKAASIMAFIQRQIKGYNDQTDPNYSFIIENGDRNFTIDPSAMIGSSLEYFMDTYCMDNAFGLEQAAYSAIYTMFAEVLARQFPYMTEGYTQFCDKLAFMTKKGYLSEDIFDSIYMFIPQFLLTRMVPIFSTNSRSAQFRKWTGEIVDANHGTVFNNAEAYLHWFPIYFKELLKDNEVAFNNGQTKLNLKALPLINSIEEEAGGKNVESGLIYLKVPEIGSFTKESKSVNKECWEAMLNGVYGNTEEERTLVRELAEHLRLYSFFLGGQAFSPLSMSSLESTNVRTSIDGYTEFFNRIFNLDFSNEYILEKSVSNEMEPTKTRDMLKSFILHNFRVFYQFRKEVPYKASARGDTDYEKIKSQLSVTPGRFKIDATTKNSPFKLYAEETKDASGVVKYKFVPTIIIDGEVYMCDNKEEPVNFFMSGGQMTYHKMALPISSTDFSTPSTTDEEKVNYRNLTDEQRKYKEEILKSLRAAVPTEERSVVQNEGYTSCNDNAFDGGSTTDTSDNKISARNAARNTLYNIFLDIEGADQEVIDTCRELITILNEFKLDSFVQQDVDNLQSLYKDASAKLTKLFNSSPVFYDTQRSQLDIMIKQMENLFKELQVQTHSKDPEVNKVAGLINDFIRYSKKAEGRVESPVEVDQYDRPKRVVAIDGVPRYITASQLARRRKARKQTPSGKKVKNVYQENTRTVYGNIVEAMFRLLQGYDEGTISDRFPQANRGFIKQLQKVADTFNKILDNTFGDRGNYCVIPTKFYFTGLISAKHIEGVQDWNKELLVGEPDLIVIGKRDNKVHIYIIDMKTYSTDISLQSDMTLKPTYFIQAKNDISIEDYMEQQLALQSMLEATVPTGEIEYEVHTLLLPVALNYPDPSLYVKEKQLDGKYNLVNRDDNSDITAASQVTFGDDYTTLDKASEKYDEFTKRVKEQWRQDEIKIEAQYTGLQSTQQIVKEEQNNYKEKCGTEPCA